MQFSVPVSICFSLVCVVVNFRWAVAMAAAGSDGAGSRAVPGQPGGKAAFSAQHTTDREIADHAIRSERLDMAAQRDFAVDHDALTESCPSEEKRLDLKMRPIIFDKWLVSLRQYFTTRL